MIGPDCSWLERGMTGSLSILRKIIIVITMIIIVVIVVVEVIIKRSILIIVTIIILRLAMIGPDCSWFERGMTGSEWPDLVN